MDYGETVSGWLLGREQVRRVDQVAISEWGCSGLVLMENAGRGVCDVLCAQGVGNGVAVFCARGNNGGDGFVIARHLHLRGCSVTVVLCGDADSLQGDARTNYLLLRRTGVPVSAYDGEHPKAAINSTVARRTWIVDALLGTGAKGSPREPLASLISCLNEVDARRLAVDVPSGLDCDTGEAAPTTFRADHTCTFVAAKPGLVMPSAAPYVGRLHVLDIGLPRELVEAVDGG